MKLAFSTLGCPGWPFREILSTAKDLGYQGVEIRGITDRIYAPSLPEFQDGQIEKTISELKRMNLELPCLTSACCLHQPDSDFYQEGCDYIALAKKLGTPYIRLLGDTDGYPGENVDDDVVMQSLSQLLPVAQEAGVMLLLETNGVYADSRRLLALLEKVNSPVVGVLWDIHHPARYFGESPEYTFGKLGKYIKYLHLKDSQFVDGKLTYRMIGHGDLPIQKVLSVLKKNGYDGYLSLEWVKRWNAELEEPGVVFAHYVSKMNRLLAKLK